MFFRLKWKYERVDLIGGSVTNSKTKKLSYKIESVEDLADLISGLSSERFVLLKLIKESSPGSIYQLAQLAGKSQPYVQKEMRFLEDLGLVSFKKQISDGRVKMIPVVSYSSLNIEISL